MPTSVPRSGPIGFVRAVRREALIMDTIAQAELARSLRNTANTDKFFEPVRGTQVLDLIELTRNAVPK